MNWLRRKHKVEPVTHSQEYIEEARQRMASQSVRCAECGHMRSAHWTNFQGYHSVWEECHQCHPANLIPAGREIALTYEYVDMVHKARHRFQEPA